MAEEALHSQRLFVPIVSNRSLRYHLGKAISEQRKTTNQSRLT